MGRLAARPTAGTREAATKPARARKEILTTLQGLLSCEWVIQVSDALQKGVRMQPTETLAPADLLRGMRRFQAVAGWIRELQLRLRRLRLRRLDAWVHGLRCDIIQ